MIHQIRKMIGECDGNHGDGSDCSDLGLGLVIAIVRGRLKEEEFGAAFQEEKFDVPRAPALGLLLQNVSRCYNIIETLSIALLV